MMKFNILVFLALTLMLAQSANAGPIAYGICQAGCSCVVMACYAAAGFVFGTVPVVGAPAAILACNSAFGSCQAACAVAFLVPLP